VGTQHELNVIKVGGKEFLLTAGNGEAVHLAREARSDDAGRTPFHDWRLDPKRAEGRALRERYALTSLSDPRWADTSLCGRRWISMETNWDEGSVGDSEDVSSPTCRRCLALLDQLFPEPELDDRFPLIVQLVTDTVLEHGTAEILGVPGDHQAALRKEVRTAVRKRTGHGMETYAHESLVVFVCRPIYDQHAEEHARMAAEAMNKVVVNLLSGESTAPLPSPMRLSWDAWATE
jgi:hypothetical protein